MESHDDMNNDPALLETLSQLKELLQQKESLTLDDHALKERLLKILRSKEHKDNLTKMSWINISIEDKRETDFVKRLKKECDMTGYEVQDVLNSKMEALKKDQSAMPIEEKKLHSRKTRVSAKPDLSISIEERAIIKNMKSALEGYLVYLGEKKDSYGGSTLSGKAYNTMFAKTAAKKRIQYVQELKEVLSLLEHLKEVDPGILDISKLNSQKSKESLIKFRDHFYEWKANMDERIAKSRSTKEKGKGPLVVAIEKNILELGKFIALPRYVKKDAKENKRTISR
jgi:hypothetical protein